MTLHDMTSARFQSVSYDLAHFRLFCLRPPRPLGTPKNAAPGPQNALGRLGEPPPVRSFFARFPAGGPFWEFFPRTFARALLVLRCSSTGGAYSTWAVFEEAMGVADKENLPEAASEAPPLLFKAPFGSTSRGRCFLPNAHITTLVHIYRPSGSRGVGR